MKNKDLNISIIFTIIGLIAGIFTGFFQASTLTEELYQQIISQLGSINMMIIITTIQVGIFTFISAFLGLKIARKVNLKLNFKFNKNSLLLTIIIGLATSFILSASDKFIFAQFLPKAEAYKFSFLYFISSILYGGVVEEIMLRLLVMSLIALLLWKFFVKSKDKSLIPDWVYITAIFISAILFAMAHIPATEQLLGLSTPILIRCFFLNGIGGVGFGYLYWKKGLSYAIYAHMLTHIFNQIIFMPILFN